MQEALMVEIIKTTDENFEEMVLKSEKPALVEFSAEWCGPCKKMAPIIQEIADEMGEQMNVLHMDVEKGRDTAAKFAILSIPSVLIFKDGKVIEEITGLVPKQTILDKIQKVL